MSEQLPELLKNELERFCSYHSILIASDFDGTISKLTSLPSEAQLENCARVALRMLSELPSTNVCVISGRALEDLLKRCDGLTSVRFVGSHGFEFDRSAFATLSDEQREALKKAEQLMSNARELVHNSSLEFKPCSVAFHYRQADPASCERVLPMLESQLLELDSGSLKHGKMVLEYTATKVDKGLALLRLRELFGSSAVVFFGDDRTDEDAFKAVGDSGLSIKVGAGDTIARYRVDDVETVCQALEYLVSSRRAAFAAFPRCAIQEHFLLSDRKCCALLDSFGAIVWHCQPKLDAPPIFSSLLGGPGSGFFSVESVLSRQPHKQEYIENSMGVSTHWDHLRIDDYLSVTSETVGSIGSSKLVRIVEGSGECRVNFSPRIDFGRVPTRLTVNGDELRVEGVQQQYVLRGRGWSWQVHQAGFHQSACCTRKLNSERQTLELFTVSGDARPIEITEKDFETTKQYWNDWTSSLTLPTLYRDVVTRSAVTLLALCYAPTGSIAAAATTSLPETIGGVRNWDYRFCWLRDAAFTASALFELGAADPGNRFLDWFFNLQATKDPSSYFAPLYSLDGTAVLEEAEIPELWGYKGSRPVRIGNLAAHQLQLDVIGPVVHLWATLCRAGIRDGKGEETKIAELLELIARRWKEPDSGIWEIRGPQRHYVFSKLMCWFALNQARSVSTESFQKYEELEREIRLEIETKGYSSGTETYVAAYDIHSPDAALLWLTLTGFHSTQDPRAKRTVDWINRTLFDSETVYRYLFDDNLPGSEGGFHICLAWLIQALAMHGEGTQARNLLDRLVQCGRPHNLFSEEWDPKGKMALGNFPQAYSHIGVIQAVLAVERGMRQS